MDIIAGYLCDGGLGKGRAYCSVPLVIYMYVVSVYPRLHKTPSTSMLGATSCIALKNTPRTGTGPHAVS